ncbi:MAG: T9SS type A sorting domain-containing protein [Bacteroidetes bacterium]|nr:T9SS type A sorting domain-containing protein [Bacteroidota bacterium]
MTTIRYALPEPTRVRLAVYDLLGREVATLADGLKPAGRHEAIFEASGLPSGVYLYRLEAAGRVLTGRMVLLK